MTRKQRKNALLKNAIFGVLTGILLIIVGYLWARATNLLIDIEGFGLGRMVLWFPIVGYAVMVVGVVVILYGLLRLFQYSQTKVVDQAKSEQVKKNQENALVTERSTFDKERIRGVVFDLDGTLLNTLEDLSDAVNYTLQTEGFPTKTMGEIRDIVGHGMYRLIKDALPEESDEATVNRLYENFLSAYALNYNNKTSPYPGVLELVTHLNKRGYLLAVLSNKKEEYTSELVSKHFPDIPFVNVVGDKEGQPKKPDPTALLSIVEEMMLSKSQVIFIGDSEVDMKTSKNSEIENIGVTWGFRSELTLRDSGADHIAAVPEEIIEIITQINQEPQTAQ